MSTSLNSYPSLLGQQIFLALKASGGDGRSGFLDESRIRVKFHQSSHVGKRIALDGGAAHDLPVIRKDQFSQNSAIRPARSRRKVQN